MQDTGFSTGRIQPLPRVGMKTHPYIVHTAKRKVQNLWRGKTRSVGKQRKSDFPPTSQPLRVGKDSTAGAVQVLG